MTTEFPLEKIKMAFVDHWDEFPIKLYEFNTKYARFGDLSMQFVEGVTNGLSVVFNIKVLTDVIFVEISTGKILPVLSKFVNMNDKIRSINILNSPEFYREFRELINTQKNKMRKSNNIEIIKEIIEPEDEKIEEKPVEEPVKTSFVNNRSDFDWTKMTNLQSILDEHNVDIGILHSSNKRWGARTYINKSTNRKVEIKPLSEYRRSNDGHHYNVKKDVDLLIICIDENTFSIIPRSIYPDIICIVSLKDLYGHINKYENFNILKTRKEEVQDEETKIIPPVEDKLIYQVEAKEEQKYAENIDILKFILGLKNIPEHSGIAVMTRMHRITVCKNNVFIEARVSKDVEYKKNMSRETFDKILQMSYDNNLQDFLTEESKQYFECINIFKDKTW
jgi:hypothetical protein